jgi:hypothetical protein
MINLNSIITKSCARSRPAIVGSMLIVIACFIGFASQVSATLSTSSAEYLGYVHSGEPSSDASEVIYINHLIALAPGGTATIVDANPINSHDYTRSGNALCYPSCPTAVTTGAVSSGANPPATGINVTGFTYLLGKYDGPNAGDLIWYVAGLSGTVDILANWGPSTTQYGLSHYALFNPSDPQVPEPSTLILLGAGLVVLVGVARARSRRS